MAGPSKSGDSDELKHLYLEETKFVKDTYMKPRSIYDLQQHSLLHFHVFIGSGFDYSDMKVYLGFHCPVEANTVSDAADAFVHIKEVGKGTKSYAKLRKRITANEKVSQHPNVLGVKGSLHHGDNFFLFYENMSFGSLKSLMEKYFKNGMPIKLIVVCLKEILQGLVWIHGLGRSHKEVNISHMLIDDKSQIKLAFGATVHNYGFVQDNLALPCFGKDLLGKERDVYLFGIAAVELAYGVRNKQNYSKFEERVRTIAEEGKFDRTGMPEVALPKDFQAMVCDCLNPDSAKRPTAIELLGSKIFKRKSRGSGYFVDCINKLNKA